MATAVLGAIGVAWGIAADSQMILLDAVHAVIGIQGWVLLATLLYAAVEAVLTIRDGGRAVDQKAQNTGTRTTETTKNMSMNTMPSFQ